MANFKPLILPKKLLIAISGIGIAMIIGAFYGAYQGFEPDMKWLIIGLGLNFIAFFAVLLDIIRNPIREKMYWYIALILFSIITTFIYLILRDKIIE